MQKQSFINVLLIDDDLLVLDDLQSMIDWHKEGFNIVACANNGQQAMEIMKHESVDLIIADIEMPLMNGLEFLKKVHELDSSIVALLLTAYSRFDYAREAVSLGVFNYVLKFELTPNLLLENLNKMKALRIQQCQSKQFELHQQLYKYLENNSSFELSCFQSVPLDNKNIFIVKVNACLPLKLYGNDGNDVTVSEKIGENEQLIELLNLNGVAYSSNEWEVTFIFTQSWDCYRLNQEQLHRILQTCAHHWKRDCQIIYSCCVGKSDVVNIYHKMKKLDYHLFYCPLNSCIDLKELILMSTSTVTQDKACFESLESSDSGLLALQIKQCLEYIDKSHLNIRKHFEIIRAFFHHLRRLIQQASLIDHEDYAYWTSICNFEQFNTFVLSYLKQIEACNGQKFSRKVMEMCNFIHNHYGDENVIEELADYLTMNREYMSKLFKKETGESLSSYLLGCRMKKAYQLLTNTHLKIYEIAELCGYNSSQYFSMVFTKYYRCSPSDIMNANNL